MLADSSEQLLCMQVYRSGWRFLSAAHCMLCRALHLANAGNRTCQHATLYEHVSFTLALLTQPHASAELGSAASVKQARYMLMLACLACQASVCQKAGCTRCGRLPGRRGRAPV